MLTQLNSIGLAFVLALHFFCLTFDLFSSVTFFCHVYACPPGGTEKGFTHFFFFNKLHLNSQCTILFFGTVSPCYHPNLSSCPYFYILLSSTRGQMLWSLCRCLEHVSQEEVDYFNSPWTSLKPTKSRPALDPLVKTFTKGLPSISFCRLLQWLHIFLWILLSR